MPITFLTNEDKTIIDQNIAQLSEEINNISDPPDVSAFITRAVNDLENYYRKDETYTCEEIDGRISAIPKFTISVVSSLPTVDISETTIYLLRDGVDGNMYTEHIYVGGTWEILGSQRVDLTGYATQTWTLQQLAGYQPKGNYLTEHQDISGKLDANKLPEAVNTALAQAKASGEFDGANGDNGLDGVSPTVSISKSGKVTTISITDKNGTKTATVNDGADGSAGADGKDGTSVTHSWNGTTLTVTSASGTTSANLKGDKGDKGDTGGTGADGTSVTVKSVSESTTDGGSNVVTFSDGKTLTVKNGSKGSTGADGYTPIKGTDYFTEADKAEFSEYIASELAKRAQLKPEFANSIEECEDESLLYVLPDGYIYGYIKTIAEDVVTPNFTNLMDNPNAYIKDGYRYSYSSAIFKEQSTDCAVVIPIPSAAGLLIVRARGTSAKTVTYSSSSFYFGTDNQTFSYANHADNFTYATEENGDIKLTQTNYPGGYNYAVFHVDAGTKKEDLIVTANEEITYTITPGGATYKWTNTGHAFVPADYEDRIIAVERKAESNTERITTLENKPSTNGDAVMYISPTGDDANSGLSASTPKKTVAACVEAGATRISAKRGVYAEAINLTDIGSLEIFPTDNDKTYVTSETRQPIVFDTSDSLTVSALTAYNSIKRVAYSVTANTAYKQVFVDKSVEPVVSASQSSYKAALWLFSDDETTVCRKPKPVLTVAECEAEANTFCFSGGYIYVNADMTGVTKIIAPTITASGFYVNGAERLVLNEVEVRHSGEYNFDLWNCAWVDLYKCASKYTTRASGFHPCNTNGIFRACYATKCFDGFAPNYHGHTTYIDCVSEYNYDDGMSHHAASEGTVIGGRYEGNGKGGNIPAYGAKVNIYGGLYKDNKQFGICYAGDGAGNFACGMVQGAVMVDNPVGLAVQVECDVTAMSCVYIDNATKQDIDGAFTEY